MPTTVFDPPVRRESPPEPGPLSLGDVSAQWRPIVARERRPIGMHIALRPVPQRARPIPIAEVLDCVLAGFVAEGATEFPHGMIVLAPQDLVVDDSLRRWTAPRNVLLEVGGDALDGGERSRLLFDVQRQGVRLALRHEGGPAPAGDRLKLFQYVVCATTDRFAFGVPALAWGPSTVAEARMAIDAGAHAVVGWPQEPDPALQGRGLKPMQRAVLDLIRAVQADADITELDRGFRAEPVLAYMLLTLANSPAFSTSRKIASLGQAILMIGYARLVKWLVLLLVLSSKDSAALPLVYTSVARGFTIEHLEAAAAMPRDQQDEGFIVGAFSLLDRISGQTMRDLLVDVPLPASVAEALVGGGGVHRPFLDTALAFERDAAAANPSGSLVAQAAANQALLQGLAAADAMLTMV